MTDTFFRRRLRASAALLPLVSAALGMAVCAQAQQAAAQDNGTDPTKLSTSAAVQYEHLDLRGALDAGSLKFSATMPLGIKPSIFGGGERAANWGMEVGCKVIGF